VHYYDHSGNKLVLFQSKEIRRLWHDDEWIFSVIDVVAALTDSVNPRDYWYKMKIRVKGEEGFEPSTVCRQLKMPGNRLKKNWAEVWFPKITTWESSKRASWVMSHE